MIIRRVWSLPSNETFSIKQISKLIDKYYHKDKKCLNPFAFNSHIGVTNDINPECDTDYHLDATAFLGLWEKSSVDMVLYDPPYTPRQLKEHYDSFEESKTLYYSTGCDYWSNQKDLIGHILKNNGIVISFGYDSNGLGKNRGFEIIEILLVAHGGCHNDTICTVEKKINQTRLI